MIACLHTLSQVALASPVLVIGPALMLISGRISVGSDSLPPEVLVIRMHCSSRIPLTAL